MPRYDIYDVAQVGFGPVGQTMAALLGRAGLRVAVFDRWPRRHARTHDGHLDRETWRILRSLGITGESEQELLAALDATCAGIPSVTVRCGWEAVSTTRHSDHVEVRFRSTFLDVLGDKVFGDDECTVRARCLIGADGPQSFVRRALGGHHTDFGFRENWLVCELESHTPTPPAPAVPATRPYHCFHTGANRFRIEFALLPDESADAMSAPDIVWSLLAAVGISEHDATLTHARVHTFRARVADRWSGGRLFLIGEAAHLMPPGMGQGLASGIRDAKALAWRLELAARGFGSPRLLASYQLERGQHVATLIQLSLTAEQFARTLDARSGAQQWHAATTGAYPPPPPFPHLGPGFRSDCTRADITGTLAPQGRIRVDGVVSGFDEVFGAGWILLAAPDISTGLDARRTAILEHVGGKFVALSEQGSDGEIVDVDGHYASYFAMMGLAAILYRPDFYIFAATASPNGAEALVDALEKQLGTVVPTQLIR